MTRPRFPSPLMAYLFCALLIGGCWAPANESIHKTRHLLMGTLVEISVVGPREKALNAATKALEEMKRVERLTSYHLEGADLAKVNSKAGSGPVRINRELFDLLKVSLEWAEKTNGAFDPTIGRVSELWGFSTGSPGLPDPQLLKRALKASGWEKVQLDESSMTVTIPDGMALDLGAVAKGYALDRAAGVIVSQGIQSGLINAGGDIVAIGAKAKNRPWKIGVQNPDQSNSILAVIALNDKAVVTSGDYERFFEKDQKLYHHILDPCTGFPAGGLRSVTIIASNGIIADMAATAVFVMGKEKGLRFIESSKGLACLLMDSNGSITVSSGDQDLFQIKARNQR